MGSSIQQGTLGRAAAGLKDMLLFKLSDVWQPTGWRWTTYKTRAQCISAEVHHDLHHPHSWLYTSSIYCMDSSSPGHSHSIKTTHCWPQPEEQAFPLKHLCRQVAMGQQRNDFSENPAHGDDILTQLDLTCNNKHCTHGSMVILMVFMFLSLCLLSAALTVNRKNSKIYSFGSKVISHK